LLNRGDRLEITNKLVDILMELLSSVSKLERNYQSSATPLRSAATNEIVYVTEKLNCGASLGSADESGSTTLRSAAKKYL
jgi:hypothetical protein